VPDPTLYLFDGYNVLHAAGVEDRRELVDLLASFVAVSGARGVVVFDGVGVDERHGALEVRYAPHADALLERLAAEHRDRERVCLVSSDEAVRGTSGQQVAKVSSREFASTLAAVEHREERPSRVADRVDEETRARLEKMRRGPVE
jgi:predicted RNA-binding protein with PIN domain